MSRSHRTVSRDLPMVVATSQNLSAARAGAPCAPCNRAHGLGHDFLSRWIRGEMLRPTSG